MTEFSEADLRGARFARSDLSGARFKDRDLSGAQLREVDLTNADALGLPWDGMPVVLNEEWEHRLYAKRDLAVLESRLP